jgi:hypothetical protein
MGEKDKTLGNLVDVTIPSEHNIREITEYKESVGDKGSISDIHEFMDQYLPLMENLKDT